MKGTILNIRKIKNNGLHSKKAIYSNPITKAFPLANKTLKSSLTIEAAIALPLFIFFVIGVTYFLIIISLQTNIQVGIDEAARSIGKKVYLANNLENVYEDLRNDGDENETEKNSNKNNAELEDVDEETKSLVATGLNPLTIKTWILKGNLFERVSKSKIIGGVTGFRTDKSSYNEDEGILDIVVNYTYNIPFLPKTLANLNFVQRSKTHVWTGREIKLGIDGTSAERRIVYITPTGTVYHTSKSCPFLDLSIQMVDYSRVNSLRNKSEGKYYRCSDCAKGKAPAMVYITDYGTKWHSNPNCSGLKRTIIEKDISEIGDMHMCSKCAAGETAMANENISEPEHENEEE